MNPLLTGACLRRCQSQLAQLGFPVLPMCQLHQSDFDIPQSIAPQETESATASSLTETSDSTHLLETDEPSGPITEQATSTSAEPIPTWQTKLEGWMSQHSFRRSCFVVKPADATQSQQTWLVDSLEMIEQRAQQIFAEASTAECGSSMSIHDIHDVQLLHPYAAICHLPRVCVAASLRMAQSHSHKI